MIENRRVRFICIEGLDRSDLGLTGEVWLEDLSRAVWASREALRLGVHLIRYMSRPDAGMLNLKQLEAELQLSRDEVRRALALMQGYGAVEAFSLQREEVRVGLTLTVLQRLRVREAKRRWHDLSDEAADVPGKDNGDCNWVVNGPAGV